MEMEPIITAGAAVALSVAGFFMSNKKSKPRSNLRSTRSGDCFFPFLFCECLVQGIYVFDCSIYSSLVIIGIIKPWQERLLWLIPKIMGISNKRICMHGHYLTLICFPKSSSVSDFVLKQSELVSCKKNLKKSEKEEGIEEKGFKKNKSTRSMLRLNNLWDFFFWKVGSAYLHNCIEITKKRKHRGMYWE